MITLGFTKQMQSGKLSIEVETGATLEEVFDLMRMKGEVVKIVKAQTEIPTEPNERMEFILAKAMLISQAAEAIRNSEMIR